MNDEYAYSDYRAVMPYTGDAGIYRDDEYARLVELDECFNTYGPAGGYNMPTNRQRPA